MSTPEPPAPALLVFGLLRAPSLPPGELLDALAACFGPLRAVEPERPFARSSYYERELGGGLLRSCAAVEGTVDPWRLAELKLAANDLESHWSEGGRRRANVDPGLLNLTQLVLASGKPAGHRVYLGQGVYAEVEYRFESGTFKPLPWTYPDYREARVIEFFNGLREAYRVARKRGTAGDASEP